jgi:hypothetical protein
MSKGSNFQESIRLLVFTLEWMDPEKLGDVDNRLDRFLSRVRDPTVRSTSNWNLSFLQDQG